MLNFIFGRIDEHDCKKIFHDQALIMGVGYLSIEYAGELIVSVFNEI